MESRVGGKTNASSLHASNKSINQISSSVSAAMSVKNYEPIDSPSLINVDKRFNIGPKGELSGLVAETVIGDKGSQGKKYQQNITALKCIE